MICVQLEKIVYLSWDKELGQNLSKTRKLRLLTRKQLGLMIGISYGLLEKLETGLVESITKDNLYLISNALNVDISELYPVIEIKI